MLPVISGPQRCDMARANLSQAFASSPRCWRW
jgi:hypothetical protein